MVALSNEPAMLSFELVCFGPPAARLPGRPVPAELRWRKHLAFLVYLALSPDQTRSRQHLLGMLWPERDEQQARHSLNEAVRRLRGCLGDSRIVTDGDSLTLRAEALEVDALRFEKLAATQPGQALALLRGDFLEGFSARTAPAFEDWMAAMRERYRNAGADLLLREGSEALLRSRLEDAAALARRALGLVPYSERAADLAMRALALNGDAAGALACYHGFAEQLQREIAEHPSRELSALAERIRRERWRAGSATWSERVPLIPRASDRAAFATIDTALRSGPGTLIISGNHGTGRSRLLAECMDRMALAGAMVAVARPLETDHDAPWSTLRTLMRAGLGRAPGIVAADPEALGLLAAVVPELVHKARPGPPRDAAEIASALAELIRAAAEEGPIGLAIDNAELADGLSIAALHAAMATLDAVPIALVLTVPRSADLDRRELLALRGEVGRSLQGLTVRLEPFAPSEIAAAVRTLAPWCRDPGDADRLARRLAFETSGNPLLLVTLLRALEQRSSLRHDTLVWPAAGVTFDSPLPISVPELARLAIVAQVTGLDEPARRVLAVASTLGLALDLELVASLAECPRSQIEASLPEMERAGLIVSDGERYAFAAPLVAQVVRSEFLTPGQRRAVCRSAIDKLAPRDDLESRILRVELMAAAERGPAAFAEALAVAREALAAGALRTARRAAEAAKQSAAAAGAAELADLERIQGEADTALRSQH
ncbi:MAG TPA: AAA family ATPase [Gemmatimonadales bacterium]|nr:AAA family ATPase [Gemmatimonadales bacterium]